MRAPLLLGAGFLVACARGEDVPAEGPACLDEAEGAILASHLAEMEALAVLVRAAGTDRAMGFLASTGMPLRGPTPVEVPCSEGAWGVDDCAATGCWEVRCNGEGWAAVGTLTPWASGGWVATPQRVVTRWLAESPGVVGFSSAVEVRAPEGAVWDVLQHGTLAGGVVALAETYTGLREGTTIGLRWTGGQGTIEMGDRTIAELEGHTVARTCGPGTSSATPVVAP